MAEPELTFTSYAGFDELPPGALEAFGDQVGREYFFQPRWFRYLVRHFYSRPEEFRVWLGTAADGTPALLMPLRETWLDPKALGAHTVQAASHWENAAPLCLLTNDAAGRREDILAAFFRFLRSRNADAKDGAFDALRIWPLELAGEDGKAIRRALRRAGFWLQRYKNSFNRYEAVEGMDYEAYLQSRSSNSRYDIGRKTRRLERDFSLAYDLYKGPLGLERGIADYEHISEASWKKPMSMVGPHHTDLLQDTMEAGVGRLSILKLDGQPVSVHFWIISDGTAHIVRLAYDQHFEKQGVGVVHTAEMVRMALDDDHVREINYGYGNDSYKARWTKESRVLYGLMAFNPGTLRGLRFAVTNILGSLLKAWLVIAPLRFVVRLLGIRPAPAAGRRR